MPVIERNITVIEQSYVKPINIVQYSNLFDIHISITDWSIPGDSVIYWQVANGTDGEINQASFTGNTIMIQPYKTTFKKIGETYLQCRIEQDGRELITFEIKVNVKADRIAADSDGSNSSVIDELVDYYINEKQEVLNAEFEMVSQKIQSVGQETLDSIPADYTALSNEVLHTDLLSIDKMMSGYIGSNGAENLRLTDNEMMSDYIEIEPETAYTLFEWVTVIRTGAWYRYAWYDENKTFISAANKGASGLGYRERHQTITSPANAKYIRVAFRSFDDGVLSLYTGTLTEAVKPTWYVNKRRPHITDAFNVKSIAHRGYTVNAPENTLPAYVEAKKRGFRFVECDIDMTSDNIPVLLHDATIDRTSDGTGEIHGMTFDEALQYDFGSWKSEAYAGTRIPSFEQFICLCYDLDLYPYVDINTPTYIRDNIDIIVDIVKSHDMLDRTTFISSSHFTIEKLKVICPEARIGIVTDNNCVWDTVVRVFEFMQSTKNSQVCIARKSTVNPASANYVAGWETLIEHNIPIEIWCVFDYDLATFDANKSVSGYITETITYDEYMAEKWNLSS